MEYCLQTFYLYIPEATTTTVQVCIIIMVLVIFILSLFMCSKCLVIKCKPVKYIGTTICQNYDKVYL